MHTFPVISSILSAEHLKTFVVAQYGMSDEVLCRIIRAGVNHTYSITNGDNRYVFRVYARNWRSRHEICEELKLVQLLSDSGIAVSYGLADKYGDHIQEINAPEGMRYGVLFSYADGEKILNTSPETHYSVGAIMANIHQKTEGIKLEREDYTPHRMLEASFDQLKPFVPADTEEMQFMQRAQQYLLTELNAANTDDLRTGALHLDIWFDNLNINKQQQITIFDFDFCGNGWLCYDIAYYIMQLYFMEPNEQIFAEKTSAFLKGYESVTPLTAEEKRLIPLLGTVLYFFYMGIQCQRFDDWSNVFVSEAYLKRYIVARVKRYYDYATTHALPVN